MALFLKAHLRTAMTLEPKLLRKIDHEAEHLTNVPENVRPHAHGRCSPKDVDRV